jgi:hypothetical protein
VDKMMVGARQDMLRKALALMEDALALLDEADCSADVGAHLDLALWRLKEIVPEASAPAGGGTLGETARAAE